MLLKFFVLLMASLSILMAGCSNFSQNNYSSSQKQNLTAANYNVQLGMGYLQQDDRERAKRKLLLALKQAPNWHPALGAMAYYSEVSGDVKSAEYYYKRAISLGQGDGSTFNNYGTFLCRTHNTDKAIRYFLKAATNPTYLKSAEAYENAGLCALGAHRELEASNFLLKAVTQDPNRAVSWLELGKLSYKRGDYSSAKIYLEKYLKVQEHDAQSLWLKIQIAKKLADEKTVSLCGKMLKEKFSTSSEFKLYQKMKSHD